MTIIRRGDRTINTGGGNYNANGIDGDYIQGQSKPNSGSERTERNITEDSEVSDGKGRNYVENLGGKKVNRWF